VQDPTITILIPTRNEVEKLPQHLKLLAPLLSEVAEVIAVDSESSDGTRELLDQALAPLANARVIDQPKGLYQAWNHGIRQASGKYIYVATIGDSIEPGGLQHLVEVAQNNQADVVISAPRMEMVGTGETCFTRWPIHHLLDAVPYPAVFEVDSLMKLILCYGFMPGQGIMGSSASNLYRRSFLASRPFPTDQGHGGDSVWGCKYAVEAKIYATRRICARFLAQPVAPGHASQDQIVTFEAVLNQVEASLKYLGVANEMGDVAYARAFLLGRLETNKMLIDGPRLIKQQFEYIGDLKADLDRRGVLIEQLDEECRRLNGLVHQAPQLAKPRGLKKRIARWLDPS